MSLSASRTWRATDCATPRQKCDYLDQNGTCEGIRDNSDLGFNDTTLLFDYLSDPMVQDDAWFSTLTHLDLVIASGDLIVDTLADEQDGSCPDGRYFLRDAIEIANNSGQPDHRP